MAMPEWAFFMKKVYADKSLGIDPKATFQKPAELNNNPIFADQNFAAIAKEGQGSDSSDVQGNGDAEDYAPSSDVPVESDFSKPSAPTKKNTAEPPKVMGPTNYFPKKDTIKEPGRKGKKPQEKDSKGGNDY